MPSPTQKASIFLPQHFKVHLFLAAFFAFFLIFFYYVGLPYDFSADFIDHDRILRHMSYRQLFGYTVNPLTPAWFFMTEMGYLRPVYYLFVKFFFNVFGPELYPVHIAIAVGNALLCGAFFALACFITKRKIYAWFIVLLYLSVPTNATMLLGYLSLDMQFLHSVVNLIAFVVFSYLTWARDASSSKRIGLLLSWVLLTWLSIKWKSSEKLLPFVYLFFLFAFFKVIQSRLSKRWFFLIASVNILMFLLVVPVNVFQGPKIDYTKRDDANFLNVYTEKDQRMFNTSLTNIVFRTFVQPHHENPLSTPFLKSSPNTLTGDLGFFVGWFFWLSFLLSPFLIWRCQKRPPPDHNGIVSMNFLIHCYFLFALWFLAIFFGFASGAPINEVRYLNFALVPIMPMLAFFIRLWTTNLSSPFFKRKVLPTVLTLFFGVAIIPNFKFLSKKVGHFGGMQYALVEIEKMIYQNHYGSVPTIFDLHYKHPELENQAVLVGWYQLSGNWKKRAEEKLRENGHLYVKTRSDQDPIILEFQKDGYKIEHLGAVHFSDAPPLMFGLYKQLSHMGLSHIKERQIYLYKVT